MILIEYRDYFSKVFLYYKETTILLSDFLKIDIIETRVIIYAY